MTMVRSRLVRTEEVDSLFCWVVEGLPGAALAAFWAQVYNERPRTAAYISKSRLDILCSYRSDLLPHLDGDILPLQILAGKEKFTLWNIYNERKKLTPDSRPLYTMDRTLNQLQIPQHSILCGDFNAHYSLWNSAVHQQIRGDVLVE